MPKGTHTEKLPVSIENVWSFVSDINQWAPLMPGYVDHDILNDSESNWAFVGDIGIIKKQINLKVQIQEWQEPTRITFNLKGLNEKFTGQGSFTANTQTDDTTEMTGHLEIDAKGLKAPAINQALKAFLPGQTRKFTQAIAQKIAGNDRLRSQQGS